MQFAICLCVVGAAALIGLAVENAQTFGADELDLL